MNWKKVLPMKQNLVFLISWCLPVIKWEKLSRQNANCAMFADEYWNIQTETVESEFQIFAKFGFWKCREWNSKQTSKKNWEEDLIKVLKKAKKVSIQAGRHILHYAPGKHGFNRANNITGFLAEFGYSKYLIVPFWYASAAYQARLVSPWVFWLDCVSPKYEPWLDQTRLKWSQTVMIRWMAIVAIYYEKDILITTHIKKRTLTSLYCLNIARLYLCGSFCVI